MVNETPEQKGARAKAAEAAKVAAAKESLVRHKRAIVRRCNSTSNAVQQLVLQPVSAQGLNQIAAHIESWKSSLTELFDLDMKLMNLIPKEVESDAMFAEEENISEDYTSFNLVLNKLIGTYQTLKENFERPAQADTSSNRYSFGRPSFLDSAMVMPMLNLNKVAVPKFDGNFANFPEFYSEFISIVDKMDCLDDCQRLKLLKRAMVGKVENLLADVGTDGELYKPTLRGLYDTYYNRRRIIAEHFATIADLPVIKGSEIREALDKIKRALRGLKVCGVNVDELSSFVAFLVARRIPDKLRTDWDTSNMDYTAYQSFESLAKFLIARCLSYEATVPHKNVNFKPFKSGCSSREPVSNVQSDRNAFSSSKDLPTCPCCGEGHYLDQCKTFNNKTVLNRFEFVKASNLCLKCFRKGHSLSKCNSKYNCKVCKGAHHFLLHRERNASYADKPITTSKDEAESSKMAEESNNKKSLAICMSASSKNSVLSTAVVYVCGKNGPVLGRVMFDGGSETSLITRDFCDRAKINTKKGPYHVNLGGIHGNSKKLTHESNFVLKSRINSFCISIRADVINKIPFSLNRKDVSNIIRNNSLLTFGESEELPYSHVDILIGTEYAEFIFQDHRRFIEGVCLRDSFFGVIISGSVERSSFAIERKSFCGLSNIELSDQFSRFMNLDNFADERLSQNDDIVEHELINQHFEDTYAIDKLSGRFVVRLPTKESVNVLHGSYSKVRSMVLGSEKCKTTAVKKAYNDIIEEYVELGHLTIVDKEPDEDAYYIPHHLVVKNTLGLISNRLVFNASFKDDSNTSLNDHLLNGYPIQRDLFSQVNTFRERLIAFCADIFRMYRSILVHADDFYLQHILLFLNKLVAAILRTLTNGIGPASFIAMKCLDKAGDSIIEKHPRAGASIKEEFYMDNWMSGESNVEAAIKLQKIVHSTLAQFGLNLCKYQSNSVEFLNSLDQSLVAPLQQKVLGGEEFVSVLGLLWNPQADSFSVNIKFDELPKVLTKRVMLSDASKIFDVLGILAPVTIKAKILLQELWKEGRLWDEPISKELEVEYLDYRTNLLLLVNYSIPRCYQLAEGNILNRELLLFADASTKGYACVAYYRIEDNEKVKTTIVCSKTRIAPIKVVHIHRLELMAIELAVKLANRLIEELCFDRSNVYFFSDSEVALSWVNIEPIKLKLFVSNRVRKINSSFSSSRFFYVKGSNNPADLATRGISAKSLIESPLWIHGPDFLQDNAKFRSYTRVAFKSILNLPEIKREGVLCSTITHDYSVIILILKHFSSWFKIVSIIAFMYRFVARVKRITDIRVTSYCDISCVVPLTIEERDKAFWVIIRAVQLEHFQNEFDLLSANKLIDKKSKLIALNPFVDENKIIRCAGRLSAAALSLDTKFPIIVDARSLFVEKYVDYVHVKYFHASRLFVIAQIRAKYYVVGNLIAVVKKVIRKCVRCTRIRAETMQQLMADLPKCRLNASRPFSQVGVDLTGAISIKCTNHRNTKFIKMYLAFFVCLVTRAVHIEIVEDLTSEAFLNTLERFVSRRGVPALVYSDNGTNFVGTKNLLAQSKCDHFLVEHEIRWCTIAPRSPHQGGIWEAAVKSGKTLLMKAIGAQTLNVMELMTIACKIEGIMNSRPLTYRKVNEFVEPITPAHFLIGSLLTEVPVIDNTKLKLKTRYRLWCRIIESFWCAWRKDYLNQLRVRTKWQERKRNLVVGDVVIFIQANESAFDWPLGLVTAIYPDKEGLVRNVDLQLRGGVRKTSIQNLILLQLADEEV